MTHADRLEGMQSIQSCCKREPYCDRCAALKAGAAALREVDELRARESSLDDLLTGLGFTEGSLYQRIADLDWERKELRARMEDARRLAQRWMDCNSFSPSTCDCDDCVAARRILHPAPAQATCETCFGRGQRINGYTQKNEPCPACGGGRG